MKTGDQLITALAVEIDMVGIGQPLSDEEQTYLSDRVSGLVADAQARKILYLPNLDQIPDQVFEPLMAMLAARLSAGTGGQPVSEAEMELIESRVRDVTRPMAPRRTLQTDIGLLGRRGGYFNPVTGR